jgi:hypothetical protein
MLYGDVDHVDERHRHRYEVNPIYVPELEKQGMIFTGQSEDGNRMEIMELNGHPYFVAVQYHPEYISRPHKPSAPYLGLVLAATGKLKRFLELQSPSKNGKNKPNNAPNRSIQFALFDSSSESLISSQEFS